MENLGVNISGGQGYTLTIVDGTTPALGESGDITVQIKIAESEGYTNLTDTFTVSVGVVLGDVTAEILGQDNIIYNPDMSVEEICDAMIAQFTSMSFNGLTGTNMTWGANGEVSKMPTAVVISNGAYVTA